MVNKMLSKENRDFITKMARESVKIGSSYDILRLLKSLSNCIEDSGDLQVIINLFENAESEHYEKQREVNRRIRLGLPIEKQVEGL